MTEPNGFYYMRARYYDPQVGRFISEDPLGFESGDLNLYVYAANNPILFIDPWGLCARNTFWGNVETIGSGAITGVAAWLGEHGNVGVTFNAGTGFFGVSSQVSITDSGIIGRVGVGWGIGVGVSVTGGVSVGNSSGWGVSGSVSGSSGAVGGTGSGTISQGGSSAGGGAGWGVGGGGTVTFGYESAIWSW